MMQLLVQSVGAGAALALVFSVLSYGLYLIVKYLRTIFTT